MGIRKRKSRNLEERDKILIVCQGEKTEKNYLQKMKEHLFTRADLREKIIIDIDVNRNGPQDIVNYSIRKMKDNKREGYNQVWCMFDKDTFSNIHQLVERAKSRGVRVAYSNKCFELWIFLHFAYTESALNAQQLLKKVDGHFSERLGKNYNKNDEMIYNDINNLQDIAEKNAEKLLLYHGNKKIDDSNPSTTVHHLIGELRRRKANYKRFLR